MDFPTVDWASNKAHKMSLFIYLNCVFLENIPLTLRRPVKNHKISVCCWQILGLANKTSLYTSMTMAISADLSPIDHLINLGQRFPGSPQINNLEELETDLRQQWNAVARNNNQILIRSMTRGCTEPIIVNAGHTRYSFSILTPSVFHGKLLWILAVLVDLLFVGLLHDTLVHINMWNPYRLLSASLGNPHFYRWSVFSMKFSMLL